LRYVGVGRIRNSELTGRMPLSRDSLTTESRTVGTFSRHVVQIGTERAVDTAGEFPFTVDVP